ncbi:6-phosphogluconolactonase [Foetidibacter luteolus]|uniref:6-phosphogluconolactonase n=1 Tax=Foetidibacter luteolus TaxID=2608880 RepID=UPI001A996B6F|nr:glucosamine-6-phosphate deaminase [Foetidibacter luteolus]
MQLNIYKNYQELSEQVARQILQQVIDKPEAVICMASGDTPKLTCQLLAAMAAKEGTDFSRATFIGLDEWLGIPPDNTGSCHYFLHHYLFEPLRLATGQVFVFDALTANPAKACADMDAVIAEKGGIDLMIVGIGMNGHIGFNEPGVSFNLHAHVIDLDETTITVGQKYFAEPVPLSQGITLGLQHLLDARKAIVIANGAKKAGIIYKTIHNKIGNDIPATVIRLHNNGEIAIDEEAASMLTR